jgi:hypothetical protein
MRESYETWACSSGEYHQPLLGSSEVDGMIMFDENSVISKPLRQSLFCRLQDFMLIPHVPAYTDCN